VVEPGLAKKTSMRPGRCCNPFEPGSIWPQCPRKILIDDGHAPRPLQVIAESSPSGSCASAIVRRNAAGSDSLRVAKFPYARVRPSRSPVRYRAIRTRP
jgi:hypothetical protein